MDLKNFDDMMGRYREFWKKLDAIAIEPANISDGINIKLVHQLIVLLLSHPDPKPFPNSVLLNYVHSKGILKSIFTEKIIQGTDSLIDAIEKIRNGKPAWFHASEASALLQSMKLNLHLITRGREQTVLQISLVSVVDSLYGEKQIDGPRLWMEKLFRDQQINPTEVSIGPYDQILMLDNSYNTSLIEFLAFRFSNIYEWALMFLKVVNESTQFSKNITELDPYRNSGRLAMNKKDIKNLPIINATHEDFNPTILYFRDPVASLADVIYETSSYSDKPDRPYLMKVKGSSPEINSLIIGLFFKKVGFHTPLGGSEIYFLRAKPEISALLDSLSDIEVHIVEKADFHPYLTSMGYKQLELPKKEYMGICGLRKVVEIHSFEHISFEGEVRPFV